MKGFLLTLTVVIVAALLSASAKSALFLRTEGCIAGITEEPGTGAHCGWIYFDGDNINGTCPNQDCWFRNLHLHAEDCTEVAAIRTGVTVTYAVNGEIDVYFADFSMDCGEPEKYKIYTYLDGNGEEIGYDYVVFTCTACP